MDIFAIAQQLMALTDGQPQQSGNQQNPAPTTGIGGMSGSVLIGMAIKFVQNYPGGLPALIQLFQSQGLAEQAKSWVSTGQNQPVTGQQMQQALGQQIGGIAQQANVPSQSVADMFAKALPQLIDALTPQGTLPQNNDSVSEALNALKSKIAA